MYHSNLVVGVWGGNNNNEDMPGAWGSIVPLKITHAFTQRVADEYPVGSYTRPSGILTTKVCVDTGKIPGDNTDCETESTIYIAGHSPETDTREIVYICKANDLIAENAEDAQEYDLVEEYIFLNNDLENSYQQSTYDKFIKGLDDDKYITEKPKSAICPLPLGPDNAPVVEILTPTSGQVYEAGSSMTITGNIRVLESVSSFTVSIDGSAISGASVETDKTYSVTYSIPASMTAGSHTVLVSITDNYGKVDSKSVNFTVTDPSVSVTLNSPSDGVTITFPVSLSATVSDTASSLQFFISKSGGGYSKTVGATASGSTWIATWNDNSGGSGEYTIKARAIVSGTAYDSDIITVEY